MSTTQVSTNQMSINEVSINEVSTNQVSVTQVSTDQMSNNQVTTNKVSTNEINTKGNIWRSLDNQEMVSALLAESGLRRGQKKNLTLSLNRLSRNQFSS